MATYRVQASVFGGGICSDGHGDGDGTIKGLMGWTGFRDNAQQAGPRRGAGPRGMRTNVGEGERGTNGNEKHRGRMERVVIVNGADDIHEAQLGEVTAAEDSRPQSIDTRV